MSSKKSTKKSTTKRGSKEPDVKSVEEENSKRINVIKKAVREVTEKKFNNNGVVDLWIGNKAESDPIWAVNLAKKLLLNGDRNKEKVEVVVYAATARRQQGIQNIWSITKYRSDMVSKLIAKDDEYGNFLTVVVLALDATKIKKYEGGGYKDADIE